LLGKRSVSLPDIFIAGAYGLLLACRGPGETFVLSLHEVSMPGL